MTELQGLVTKRGRVKANLTRLSTLFDSISAEDAPWKIAELELRVQNAEKSALEFDLVQSLIEKLDPTNAQLQERDIFENV
ncbi:Retrotransposon protein [Nesidiocoris tenuis]|uniref:Retrotransposon protein n=1 Tax=Nesidiocoris tenuis TaxID=355587 RepID=A0ABN7AHD2_9HEMI|nr:Retrotransposon protein [Nesidiocoris tenuis]